MPVILLLSVKSTCWHKLKLFSFHNCSMACFQAVPKNMSSLARIYMFFLCCCLGCIQNLTGLVSPLKAYHLWQKHNFSPNYPLVLLKFLYRLQNLSVFFFFAIYSHFLNSWLAMFQTAICYSPSWKLEIYSSSDICRILYALFLYTASSSLIRFTVCAMKINYSFMHNFRKSENRFTFIIC